MKSFGTKSEKDRRRANLWRLSLFLFIAAVCGAAAQMRMRHSRLAAVSSLSVALDGRGWRQHRKQLDDNNVFAAPCDVDILASVGAVGNLRAGDTVMVEFFENTNKI